MKVVLDTSAALEIAFHRRKAMPLAEALLGADERLAPHFLVAEATNAVWKEHQLGGASLATCETALDIVLNLVAVWVPSTELCARAFELSRVERTPAYDMFYLALARREKALLLTMDAGLRKAAVRHGVRTA